MASSFFLLLLLVPATSARYVSGEATETQAGIMPMDGVSPVPTELNGIPKDAGTNSLNIHKIMHPLRKRRSATFI